MTNECAGDLGDVVAVSIVAKRRSRRRWSEPLLFVDFVYVEVADESSMSWLVPINDDVVARPAIKARVQHRGRRRMYNILVITY